MSSDWTPATDRPGYRSKTIKRGPCTVVIYRPELNQDEAARRERHARETLERTLRDYLRRKEQRA